MLLFSWLVNLARLRMALFATNLMRLPLLSRTRWPAKMRTVRVNVLVCMLRMVRVLILGTRTVVSSLNRVIRILCLIRFLTGTVHRLIIVVTLFPRLALRILRLRSLLRLVRLLILVRLTVLFLSRPLIVILSLLDAW